jgi:hypothetical protein
MSKRYALRFSSERSESLERFAVHWFTRPYLYSAAFAATRTLRRSAQAPYFKL